MRKSLVTVLGCLLLISMGASPAQADIHYRRAGSERIRSGLPTVQFFPDDDSFLPRGAEVSRSRVSVTRRGSGHFTPWRQWRIMRLGGPGRTTVFLVYSSIRFRPVLHKSVTETTYRTVTERVRISYARCRVESRRLVSDRTSYATGWLSGQITVEYTGICEGDTPDFDSVTYRGSWRDDIHAWVTYYPSWNRTDALLGDVDVSKVGDIAYDYTDHYRTITHTKPETHTRRVRYLGSEDRLYTVKRYTITRTRVT